MPAQLRVVIPSRNITMSNKLHFAACVVCCIQFQTRDDGPLQSKDTYHQIKLISEDEMINFDMTLKWLYICVVLNPAGNAIFA